MTLRTALARDCTIDLLEGWVCVPSRLLDDTYDTIHGRCKARPELEHEQRIRLQLVSSFGELAKS